jgi:hypothetical protein
LAPKSFKSASFVTFLASWNEMSTPSFEDHEASFGFENLQESFFGKFEAGLASNVSP